MPTAVRDELRQIDDLRENLRLAIRAFQKANPKIGSLTQLAKYLNTDAGFLSRLLGNKKVPIGPVRIHKIAPALGLTVAELLTTGSKADLTAWNKTVARLSRNFSPLGKRQLVQVLTILSVLSAGEHHDDENNHADILLRSFLSIATEREKSFDADLGNLLSFEQTWKTYGLFIQCFSHDYRGHFYRPEAQATLDGLIILTQNPCSFRLVTEYFKLHGENTTLPRQGEAQRSFEERLAAYYKDTGGHFTAERLISKFERHRGEYEAARLHAESAIKKIHELGNSMTYLDWLELVKARRDLLCTITRQFHAAEYAPRAVKLDSRGRVELFRKGVQVARATQKDIRSIESLFFVREIKELQKLSNEMALLYEYAPVRPRNGEVYPEPEDCVKQSLEYAVQGSDGFGIIRSNEYLYWLYMKRGQHMLALRALSEIAIQAGDDALLPRMRAWLTGINEHHLNEKGGATERLIAELCSHIVGKDS